MFNLKNKPHKNLKYLWVAELADGTFVKQTHEDKSVLDSKRNCYYDLLQLIEKGGKGKTIRRFSLVGQDTKTLSNTLTVDLGTGIFYVNGLALLLESDKLPAIPEKFNLIWYYQVARALDVTFDKKSGKTLKAVDRDEFREYFIGWQCNVAGKNYQQKLAVA